MSKKLNKHAGLILVLMLAIFSFAYANEKKVNIEKKLAGQSASNQAQKAIAKELIARENTTKVSENKSAVQIDKYNHMKFNDDQWATGGFNAQY